MKQAITRTIFFSIVIVLLELGVGYYKVNSAGGAYSLSDFNIGLIPIFILAYFVIQVLKYRRLNNPG